MKYYVIGDDKSWLEVEELLLQLSGGSMTGNIAFDSGSRNKDIIRFIKGDANASGISIGDGGTTVIGGGDSATLLQPANNQGAADKMIIGSDTTIDFYVNCQNGLNAAVKVSLDRTGLLSGHQKKITSGTALPSGGSDGDIYIQY